MWVWVRVRVTYTLWLYNEIISRSVRVLSLRSRIYSEGRSEWVRVRESAIEWGVRVCEWVWVRSVSECQWVRVRLSEWVWVNECDWVSEWGEWVWVRNEWVSEWVGSVWVCECVSVWECEWVSEWVWVRNEWVSEWVRSVSECEWMSVRPSAALYHTITSLNVGRLYKTLYGGRRCSARFYTL